MIVVLAWWCMVLFATIPMGFALVRSLAGREHATINDTPLVHVFIAGLFATTIWAMGWSLFAGLGPLPLVLWAALSLLLGFIQHHDLRRYLAARTEVLRGMHGVALLGLAALFTVALLKSCDPSELIEDDGGYILPYLRWLEQFGAVPGIANIDDRFGFNSALHATTALFSLWWVDGQGLYDLNGLALVMVAAWFMGGASELLRGGPVRLTAILKVFSLLFFFRNMLTGPRPDLPAVLIAEMVLVLAAEKIEARSTLRPDLCFKLLILYCVFLAGIKLTAILVGLFPLYLFVKMLVSGVHLPVRKLGALALLFLFPWMVMNAVISGYLVYPLYQFDVLRVDWKVPGSVVRQQYCYVSEFAKTNARPTDSERLYHTRTLRQWVPVWFARENGVNKAAAIALLTSLLGLLIQFLHRGRKLWHADRELVLLGTMLIAADVVWFLRTPAFRFGWATIIGLIAINAFLWLRGVRNGYLLRGLSLAMFACCTLLFVFKTLQGSHARFGEVLLRPAPVQRVAYREVEIQGVTVREAEGYPCWGTAPPCFHKGTVDTVEPRGPSAKDGFRAALR